MFTTSPKMSFFDYTLSGVKPYPHEDWGLGLFRNVVFVNLAKYLGGRPHAILRAFKVGKRAVSYGLYKHPVVAGDYWKNYIVMMFYKKAA